MSKRLLRPSLALLGLAGCNVDWCGRFNLACEPPTGTIDDSYGVDQDADLWPAGQDCDDDDPLRYPGAEEACDGIDNDCNGVVDDGRWMLPVAFYRDADGDGFGAGAPFMGCAPPPASGAWTTDGRDCDDDDPAVHPAAAEDCATPWDDDCDGDTGDGDGETYVQDADGDGYGDRSTATTRCLEGEPGWVPDEAPYDCDDADPGRNPGNPEVCDADRTDEDCDGRADDSDTDTDTDTERDWYRDLDGDGYGEDGAPYRACHSPNALWVDNRDDCDDDDPAISPGTPERCDGIDQDCDGDIDEEPVDGPPSYADADADGWGDDATAAAACAVPSGRVAQGGDCDDARDDVHPGAAEADCADPTDYNCDGSVGLTDADADGAPACEDCDDADPARSPFEVEVCDAAGVDEDCDGLSDDADPDLLAASATSWTADADRDGYGAGDAVVACAPPGATWIATDGDCDDADPQVHPGEVEVCGDGIDNDCDGAAASCALSGQVDTWDAATVLVGSSMVDGLGAGLAWLGDQDGDGLPELVATTPDWTAAQGRVAVFRSGRWTDGGSVTTGSANARMLQGASRGGACGAAVATGADLDGDGYDDLLLGEPGYDGARVDNGAVWLVAGPVTGNGTTTAATQGVAFILGATDALGVGGAVAPVGDVDGDGWADLVVGAETWAGDDGRAFLFHGPLTTAWFTSGAAATLGGDPTSAGQVALAGAGDVDGDGLADLLLGDDTLDSAGAAALLLGPLTGALSFDDADLVVLGTQAGGAAGAAVTGLGDLDADGLDDFGVGAPSTPSGSQAVGRAAVFLGASVAGASALDLEDGDAWVAGGATTRELGWRLDAGDLDGDGLPDLVVSGRVHAASGGVAVWGFLGPVTGTWTAADASLRVTAASGDLDAGLGMALGRDAAGAVHTLAVGAPGSNSGRGRIFLLDNGGL